MFDYVFSSECQVQLKNTGKYPIDLVTVSLESTKESKGMYSLPTSVNR